MILLIDNYDSFAHNLARYLRRLHAPVEVVRNDAVGVGEVRRLRPDLMVLSPGPKRPEDAGICLELVRKLHSSIPIFGVCLGHQVIAEAFGAMVVRGEAVHGRASSVRHADSSILSLLPSPFSAGRYHSLVVDPESLPEDLVATAWSDDGAVMAIEHRRYRVAGVQFHPESILTSCGYELLASVLRWAGVDVSKPVPEFESECHVPRVAPMPQDLGPVTF